MSSSPEEQEPPSSEIHNMPTERCSCHLLKTYYAPVILQPLPVSILFFNPCHLLMLFSPFYGWGNWCTERRVKVHKAARLESGRAGIQILVIWLCSLNLKKQKLNCLNYEIHQAHRVHKTHKKSFECSLTAHKYRWTWIFGEYTSQNPIGNQIYSRWFRWRDVNEGMTGRGLD